MREKNKNTLTIPISSNTDDLSILDLDNFELQMNTIIRDGLENSFEMNTHLPFDLSDTHS